ncbi:hypothetical protein T310_4477 [Rasamsonia emersonii CBS 393.64]|uniref:Uncharacterized protein n=1 Tax=Rasamsonia emersonii (strain ATCC 16479 / CBS 393.64 / IMI 116815) TaxID=1408163 RepID=A0A0F4YTF0_RASE3|nr:hypothetical protein T310_4477 [Rasamsonia emersonii CBS 393.64]KKA21519.1 hypothetical protein T310_4477 [Rasamsonia emersonii CBS 393.64]
MGLLRVRFPGKGDKTKAISGKTVHATPEFSAVKDARKGTSQWKDQDADIEMEDLFQKAVISGRHAPAIGFDRVSSKQDSSMLKKFMRCKGHQHPLDEFSDKIRRNLHRESTIPTVTSKECNGEIGWFATPDLVSERGYDSDAQFISTPMVSDRSPGSARTTNLLEPITGSNRSDVYDQSSTKTAGKHEILFSATAGIQSRVEERMDCATQTSVYESETSNNPSTPQRSYSLVVTKRRNARGRQSPNVHPRSFCAADTIQEYAKGFVVQRNTTTQSKFTERFELCNLASSVHLRDPNAGNSRKVSVAWMSDGRRFGYGYSFVHNDEDGATTHGVNSMAERAKKRKVFEQLGESQSPQPSEGGEALGDRNGRFSLWYRFPSHTRADRNGSATFNDDVIVRNFYAGASPKTDTCDAEKKKAQPATKQKDRNSIRQWAKPSGLQGIEVLRYRAGLTVDAARSRVSKLPELEIFPFWSHAHKEESGDHEKEDKRARK